MIKSKATIAFEYFIIKLNKDDIRCIDIKYRAHSIKGAYSLMYQDIKFPIIKIWNL